MKRKQNVSIGICVSVLGIVLIIMAVKRTRSVDLSSIDESKKNVELSGVQKNQDISDKRQTDSSIFVNTGVAHNASNSNILIPDILEKENIRVREELIRKLSAKGEEYSQTLFEMKESLKLFQKKTEIKTLSDWMKEYNGNIYSETNQIDIEEDFQYASDSPEKTVKSYWRARYLGDIDELLQMCDRDAQKDLQGRIRMEDGRKTLYPPMDNATQITFLMIGEVIQDNKSYYLVYIRRLSKDVVHGLISMHPMMLRKDKDKYLITQVPLLSVFGRIDSIAAVNFYPYGVYTNLLPKFKQTLLPPHFYDLKMPYPLPPSERLP